MKKFKFMLTLAVVVAWCFAACLAAAPNEYSAALIARQPAQAQMLHELELFQGTEHGFELDKVMSRGEAAVMLVRLLGAEKEALANNHEFPFADVPAWLSPYVGWLYQNKLTAGTSAKTYSPQLAISCKQYAMLLWRVLDGKISDNYSIALLPQAVLELENNNLTRGNAVEVSARLLEQEARTGCETIAETLIGKGIFTEDALIQASSKVYSTEQLYQGMLATWKISQLNILRPADSSQAASLAQRGRVLYDTRKNIAIDTCEYVRAETERSSTAWQILCSSGQKTYLFKRNADGKTSSLVSYDAASGKTETLLAAISAVSRDVCFDTIAYPDGIYWQGKSGLFKLDFKISTLLQLSNLPSLGRCPLFYDGTHIFSAHDEGTVAKDGAPLFLMEAQAFGIFYAYSPRGFISYENDILRFSRTDSVRLYQTGPDAFTEEYTYEFNESTRELKCVDFSSERPDFWADYNGDFEQLKANRIATEQAKIRVR